jgi:integrase
MASIRKHPKSPFWFACITLPNGRQTQRSTKLTDAKKALKFAEKIEEAGRGAKLVEKQARKIVAEIYKLKNGESLPGSTARDFFAKWVANKERETAESTARHYRDHVQKFVAALDKKADCDLNDITLADVIAFRDYLHQRLSATSANQAVKVVRMALKDALITELVDRNVAVGVKRVKHRGEMNARRPFTLPELKKILSKAAGDEWEGMILFGLYAGQRLADIANLTWQNLDLDSNELAFVTRKTGRKMRIPLATPLQRYITALPAGDDPKQPLFPRAFSANRSGTLSNQFHEILVDAGLAAARTHAAAGEGRSAKRAFNEISFHALRHTTTSLLKNAGISPAIVHDLIGHDSPAVSAHYTHIEEKAKRRAIAAMPDVTERGK